MCARVFGCLLLYAYACPCFAGTWKSLHSWGAEHYIRREKLPEQRPVVGPDVIGSHLITFPGFSLCFSPYQQVSKHFVTCLLHVHLWVFTSGYLSVKMKWMFEWHRFQMIVTLYKMNKLMDEKLFLSVFERVNVQTLPAEKFYPLYHSLVIWVSTHIWVERGRSSWHA